LFNEDYYIVATGEKFLKSLSIRETCPPEREKDGTMTYVAELAKLWILEGNTSTTALDLGVTHFQEQVAEIICGIPKGYVSTYGDVARSIGCKSPRAVGKALNRNPVPLFIPCHRVVMKDGRMGGFESGSDLKEHILRKEGVLIEGGKVASTCILRMP